jgi:hypothetical protein
MSIHKQFVNWTHSPSLSCILTQGKHVTAGVGQLAHCDPRCALKGCFCVCDFVAKVRRQNT